ncbi:MAG TPA: hypothetical protein VF000_01060 [Agromyces sp.]
MPDALVLRRDSYSRGKRVDPRSGARNLEVQVVVHPGPHPEADEGREASDATTDVDGAQLVAIGRRRDDPSSARPGNRARIDGTADRRIREPTPEQGACARNFAELGQFREEIGHGHMIGRRR